MIPTQRCIQRLCISKFTQVWKELSPGTPRILVNFSHSDSSGRVGPPLSASDPEAGAVGGSSAACSAPITLDEVKVPDGRDTFKGLETDFPCLRKSPSVGPEPLYEKIVSGYKMFHHNQPFHFKYSNGILPEFKMAYETWGELNEMKDNAVLIWTGLSAHSHVTSHKDNPKEGWWEKFVGEGRPIDTSKFFVICANHIGGCFGSTGPSSINPMTKKPYATTFPMLSVDDLINAQVLLLEHLGVEKLHGSVGASLGGMCSLAIAAMYPERVSRTISISSCAATHPSSIALRYLQRRTIMADPLWNRGYYYDGPFPRLGLKLAREIAFVSYRSGPEWDQRFGRKMMEDYEQPNLCPNFLIESYLDYQGEISSVNFDPNSLLYISKAMDLYDLADGFSTMKESLARIVSPTMVIGVQTDVLIPVQQQRKLAKMLIEAGNDAVTYYELNSIYGHDTFLLDLASVGTAIKGFLETTGNNEKNDGEKRKFALLG
ncbi:uncharacterized protein LOC135500950 [Lineus longissimus]|uniref:uncharacterized protein LOC135500950 n=1 Tax=Lineus longissimus TaxID=88925 RepID=UPI002B4C7065